MVEKYNIIGLGSVMPDIVEETDTDTLLGFIDTEKARSFSPSPNVEDLPAWRIIRMQKNGDVTRKLHPEGSTLYMFTWSDRLNYTYSFEDCQI